MALLAIAYPLLTPAGAAWIEAYRRVHDERFVDIVPAHFTFVFPTTGVDAAALEAHVRSTVAGHAAFPFAIRGTKAVADAFSDDWHVFLVPEEGWAEVAALHEALYTGVLAPHLRSDMPFIPRVGIARSTSQERCEHLARELAAAGLDVQGVIASLDVVEFDGTSVRTLAAIPLG